MIKAIALLTMFGSALGVIIVSSVLLAFSTNNLPITLFVVGIEIIAFFALLAKVEYQLNR